MLGNDDTGGVVIERGSVTATVGVVRPGCKDGVTHCTHAVQSSKRVRGQMVHKRMRKHHTIRTLSALYICVYICIYGIVHQKAVIGNMHGEGLAKGRKTVVVN